MQKLLLIGCLSLFLQIAAAAPLSSSINLPIPNSTVGPMGGISSVPLSGVILNNVSYDINCQVSNPNNPESITIQLLTQSTYCSSRGGCGGYIVNGKPSTSQVNLNQANNSVVFAGIMTVDYDKKGAVSFRNLDTTASATISNCVATPTVGN